MAVRSAKPIRTLESPRFYLGVDGGGTKTHIALINSRHELVAEAFAGPSNPLRVGVETAVSNIGKAVNEACEIADVSRSEIAAATFGLAGVRRGDLRTRVAERFRQSFRIGEITVVTDAEVAWYGTTLGKPGIVVIAGTGSICFGKNAEGDFAIAGGWGPLAGDEGGGTGIGRLALQAVAKASDGRGIPTTLTDRASEYFRASGPENLIVAIYSPQIDNMRIAGFARLVVEEAVAGDPVATDILRLAGEELGTAACAVIGRLGLARKKVPVGCVGSIFNAGDILTTPMFKVIARVASRAYLVSPKLTPANAAAIMATRPR